MAQDLIDPVMRIEEEAPLLPTHVQEKHHRGQAMLNRPIHISVNLMMIKQQTQRARKTKHARSLVSSHLTQNFK